MAENIPGTLPLGQTTPVERLRDSRREAIDREGKRRNPKKSGPPAPAAVNASETQDAGDPAVAKNSGTIVDIVI
jgi:hypothetical protein